MEGHAREVHEPVTSEEKATWNWWLKSAVFEQPAAITDARSMCSVGIVWTSAATADEPAACCGGSASAADAAVAARADADGGVRLAGGSRVPSTRRTILPIARM